MKILHMFQWELGSIIPIQGTKDSGMEWWKLYQPINLKIGNEQIGSKKDLINYKYI